jgi:UDP-2-acetamido-2,6-beta-L-arabino-hexul-4-ose reductase
MKTILVTGAAGFIGKHVCLALARRGDCKVIKFDMDTDASLLANYVSKADAVIHLAGINRPEKEEDFFKGNAGFTGDLCGMLLNDGRGIPVIVSSSIQAVRDNPYGQSKLAAEQALLDYRRRSGATVHIYRLPNVFGKWSRPNYNTVVATFCHNISRGLPVVVNDRDAMLQLVYIDDVVAEFVGIICGAKDADVSSPAVEPVHSIRLGELHDMVVSFRENRRKGLLANLSDPFVKAMYSTYLSFLEEDDFAYQVDMKVDDRGWLFELVKSRCAGQIFVSKTKPGITRGNHYHDSKVEKFCVIQGRGVIRFRHVLGGGVIEYPVDDEEIKVVDIPPGLTHSIENTGEVEMITLFWANEIFDPGNPDTYFEEV